MAAGRRRVFDAFEHVVHLVQPIEDPRQRSRELLQRSRVLEAFQHRDDTLAAAATQTVEQRQAVADRLGDPADHLLGQRILGRAVDAREADEPMQIAVVHELHERRNRAGKTAAIHLVDQRESAADGVGHPRHHLVGQRIARGRDDALHVCVATSGFFRRVVHGISRETRSM
jgi:hypothetical protein